MSKLKTSSSDPPVEPTILVREDRRSTGCTMDCMKKKKLLWALIFLVMCGVVVLLLETIFELQLFKANDVGKKMGDLLIDEDKGTDGLSISDNNVISKSVETDNQHKSPESTGTLKPDKLADKSAQEQEEAASKDRNEQRPGSAQESVDNRKQPSKDKQQNVANVETDTRNSDDRNRAIPGEQPITELSSDSFWLFEAICLAVSVSGYAFVKHRQRCIDRAFLAKVNRQIDGV